MSLTIQDPAAEPAARDAPRKRFPRGVEGAIRRLGEPSLPRRPASPRAQAISLVLTVVFGLLALLLINLVFISQLEHYTSQRHLYAQLRFTLAEPATPVGPTDSDGKLVKPGTPIAVMMAPSVGIKHEVIVEGTDARQTMVGIGHRRDTVLPCQAGASVLMARAAAYGGIGSDWAKLQPGDQFAITMGQGTCKYLVMDRRLAGDPAPQPPTGKQSHLTLTTAAGSRFAPSGELRIDARSVGSTFDAPTAQLPSGALPPSEKDMAGDSSNLTSLVLLLIVLIGLSASGMWSWRRWGRWPTWIVFTPLALTFGLLTATNITYLLPNLL